MSTPLVRQAGIADLDDVLDLFEEYREFQGQRPDRAAAGAFLKARFEHGDSIVFIAHRSAAPAGFAQLYPSHSSVALARVFILNDLFVRASGRRHGVASQLLAAVEKHAWSLGAARVTLNVARDNVDAQALYEAKGWRRDQQFHTYHRHAPGGPGPDGARPGR